MFHVDLHSQPYTVQCAVNCKPNIFFSEKTVNSRTPNEHEQCIHPSINRYIKKNHTGFYNKKMLQHILLKITWKTHPHLCWRGRMLDQKFYKCYSDFYFWGYLKGKVHKNSFPE